MTNRNTMRFQGTYSHNSRDASSEFDSTSGRWVDTVRVDRRANYIVTALSTLRVGLESLGPMVTQLNHKFKGAGYTYTDVYSTIQRLVKANVVVRDGGVWKLAPGGKRRWENLNKVVR